MRGACSKTLKTSSALETQHKENTVGPFYELLVAGKRNEKKEILEWELEANMGQGSHEHDRSAEASISTSSPSGPSDP